MNDIAAGTRGIRVANLVILAATTCVWLGLDQLTKQWAISALSDGPNHIVGPFSFRLVYNSGSAFGINALSGIWLGLLAFAVVVILFFYSRNLPSRTMTILLGLVTGGALGNLADRLFRAGDGFLSGRVVDFIDLSRWPVFNLADTGIVVGTIGAAIIGSRVFANDTDEIADADKDTTDKDATDKDTTGTADMVGTAKAEAGDVKTSQP